jgi:TPR repeat protein
LRGEGVEQDFKQAFKWYALSAKQGHKRAQFDLGVMYDNGEGIPIDHEEAFKWFLLSGKQEFSRAQKVLGGMYEDGRGVEKDYVLAHMWRNLAGQKDTVGRLEKKMTPEQIEKAKEMARNWKGNFVDGNEQ